MAALSGEIILTQTDEIGNPEFVIYIFFDPVTKILRDQVQSTSRGNRTGAIVIDNQTGRARTLNVQGQSFNIPTVGSVVSAAQLAAQGLNTVQDLGDIQPGG